MKNNPLEVQTIVKQKRMPVMVFMVSEVLDNCIAMARVSSSGNTHGYLLGVVVVRD